MNDLAKQFGANLRKIRKEKGISQDNLALLAEIDRSYVGRIERGEVNITLDKAYQLANALKCDLVELLPQPRT
ncbi:transcriptional regulator, XRE family [Vibrio ishigakensis]|uniref:Transcriptional regulator, XRE family n=1 Tax=Vibrio ishigakensis TaxID=1481914 RepID=A0A0B8NXA1_9VIBR|nr:helix-turn-helix transcriptional regulator [Vibrio ishigakensis]GAM56892.1 transcriptional regulator, XRE family [Vibrio ishigakensis]